MAKIPRVQHVMQRSKAPSDAIVWDDIRILTLLVECGSIRRTATRTGLDFKTVRRRLDALQHLCGATLFSITPNGVELTEIGRKVYATGREMTTDIRALAHITGMEIGRLKTVTIGLTEGLGNFWLVPRAIDFARKNKDMYVNVHTEMRRPNAAALDVDLAIMLDPKPEHPDLIVERLGWLHVVLFASQDYIDEFGYLQSKRDIAKHEYLDISADQIKSDEAVADMTSADRKTFSNLRVNSGTGQLLGVTHGGGITALPTYTLVLTRGLKHVAPDFVLRREIWLAYNRKLVENSHIVKTINFLRRAFSPDLYPWFREEYMPPSEVNAFIEAKGMKRMFATFRDDVG